MTEERSVHVLARELKEFWGLYKFWFLGEIPVLLGIYFALASKDHRIIAGAIAILAGLLYLVALLAIAGLYKGGHQPAYLPKEEWSATDFTIHPLDSPTYQFPVLLLATDDEFSPPSTTGDIVIENGPVCPDCDGIMTNTTNENSPRDPIYTSGYRCDCGSGIRITVRGEPLLIHLRQRALANLRNRSDLIPYDERVKRRPLVKPAGK